MVVGPGAGASPSNAQAQVLEAIRRTLPGAREDSWGELASTARLRDVQAGETIIRQGEGMPLVMVVTGYGAFRRTTVTGTQLIVGIAPPEYLFGFSDGSGIRSTVEVIALTDGVVATWPEGTLRRVALADAALAFDVIQRVMAFLAELSGKLDGYLHQDARTRVVRVLARHSDLFFSPTPILSRSHLPGLVGTSREMTARVLRELERDGLVERYGRTGLRLRRPDALAAYADGVTLESE